MLPERSQPFYPLSMICFNFGPLFTDGYMSIELLVQVTKTWPANHEVVSSSLKSSQFVHIMPNVSFISNLSPLRYQLMGTNCA